MNPIFRNLIKLIVVGGLLVCFCGWSLWSHNVTGSYAGVVRNKTYGIDADLFIKLADKSGNITGRMTIGEPLYGGGDLSGVRDGKNIQFATSDNSGGRIEWIGKVNGSEIDGYYVVEPGGVNQLLNGARKQEGVWEVKLYK